MSGVALAGGLEATVGLMPGYLRRQALAAGNEPAEAPQPAPEPEEDDFAQAELAAMRGPSDVDELRQRISDAAKQERRGIRPVWIGLALIAVLAGAGLLFPDAIAALTPDVDPTF